MGLELIEADGIEAGRGDRPGGPGAPVGSRNRGMGHADRGASGAA